MQPPAKPENERVRLDGLKRLGVLDARSEARFDCLTELAATVFDAPICLVSLVDEDRQWFKSKVGLDVDETPRDISFCGHAILQTTPLGVPDVLHDARFTDNPLVCGFPDIRFYAGQPLHDAGGLALGTLCLIDTEPRTPHLWPR